MKAWRRTSRSGSPTTSPPIVTVTDVSDNGDGTVTWTFSANISAVTSFAAFLINGIAPTGLAGFAINVMTLSYTASAPGDGWFIGVSTGISFVGGGILAVAEAGIVT